MRPAALANVSHVAVTVCGCIVAFAYSASARNARTPLAPALMREFQIQSGPGGILDDRRLRDARRHAGSRRTSGRSVWRQAHVDVRAGLDRAGETSRLRLPARTGLLLACKIFTGMGTAICFVGGARYVHAGAAGPRLNVSQGFFGGSVQLGAGFVILAVPRDLLVGGMESSVSRFRRNGAGSRNHLAGGFASCSHARRASRQISRNAAGARSSGCWGSCRWPRLACPSLSVPGLS